LKKVPVFGAFSSFKLSIHYQANLFNMKKIIFVLLVITTMTISCKTAKKEAPTPVTEKAPIEKTDDKKTEPVKEVVPEDNKPIYMKTEEVSIAENEDQSKEGFAYYVIIGSFSKPENAGRFKIQLINKDFSPVLLNSESGYIRVAVDQTNSENEARDQIKIIRNKYPEHKDVWLLKKK
jgi:cell division protein FtsN